MKTRLIIGSWISYDLGNTLFTTGVVGLVFPLWLTGAMGGTDGTLGYLMATSMAALFFLAPDEGSFSYCPVFFSMSLECSARPQVVQREVFAPAAAGCRCCWILLLLLLGFAAAGFRAPRKDAQGTVTNSCHYAKS